MISNAIPRFVSRPEIARRLGISAATLTRRLWPAWETLPGWPGAAPGFAARYDWQAIETFLRAQWPAELGGGCLAAPSTARSAGQEDHGARRRRAAEALATQMGAER